jgi:hypothetical protein
MTTLTTEPATSARQFIVPLTLACVAVYLLFTALAMEVYILLPIATILFLIAVAPALRLLKHK